MSNCSACHGSTNLKQRRTGSGKISASYLLAVNLCEKPLLLVEGSFFCWWRHFKLVFRDVFIREGVVIVRESSATLSSVVDGMVVIPEPTT